MLGNIIDAGMGMIGGILGKKAAKKAQKHADAREDTAIQRRTADSLAAGIHPLFGLGASVSSSQPVIAGQVGDSMRESGQSIGRAVDAYKSTSERQLAEQMAALQMRRMGLENSLIEEQIRSERHRRVGSPPAFPEVFPRAVRAAAKRNVEGQGDAPKTLPVELTPPRRTPNLEVGIPYETNPHVVDAEAITTRYGESELLELMLALGIGVADARHNFNKFKDRKWNDLKKWYDGRYQSMSRDIASDFKRGKIGQKRFTKF